MISIRYHVVSMAAVFLALSLGIVVGSTSISERLVSTVGGQRDSLSRQADDLRSQRDDLTNRLHDSERFGRSVSPLAVRDQLNGRSVMLIATSDSRQQDRDAMKRTLFSAGARVSGEMHLAPSIADPGRADALRQIVAGLLPAGVELPVDSDPGTLAGGLLGPLLLDGRTGNPQTTPAELEAALGGLSQSGFATASPGLQPANLAVVMTGGAVSGDQAGERATTLARMAAQIDKSGGGAVLAGTSGIAGAHSPVSVIRSDPAMAAQLSTVDNADTSEGRVATALALREQAARRSGHYGVAGGAQGPIPDLRG